MSNHSRLLVCAAAVSLLSPQLRAAEPTSFRRILPGVTHTLGTDGARTETSAWLVNLGATSASFEIGFLPVSNAPAPPVQMRELGPGETLRFNRVLNDLFGLSEGEGVLVVRGDQPFELRGSGQGVSSSELLGPGANAHSLWLANRTEITAVLTAPNTAVTVSVYDPSGVLRGIEVVSSETPSVWRMPVSRFLPDPEIPVGRVKFAVTAGEATGFISVDGTIALPERIGNADLLLNGVTAVTDLRVFNPNETEQEITIEALGFPGGPATIRRMMVPPVGLLDIPGFLNNEGFVTPEGATGALRIQAPAAILATGRGLPNAVPYEAGFAMPNQFVTLLGGSQVALLAGPRGASGVLRLRDPLGVAVGTAPIRLQANEWQGKAVEAWFPGTEIPADARVDIELESGSAHGYAETQGRVLVSGTALPAVAPAATATRLVFSAMPSSITAGMPFTATVQAIRADNSVDKRFTGSIDLRAASGPSGLQAPASQNAVEGIATFRDLRIAAPGSYTLTATGAGLESAVSGTLQVAAAPPPQPTVIRVGTFAGQNGYTAAGTLQIERAADGSETLRLNRDFRVSSGAGTVTVWLTRSNGPVNTANSVRVGALTRVFSGEFTFPIPSPGSNGFTHIVVYCDAFRINFGAAQLRNP